MIRRVASYHWRTPLELLGDLPGIVATFSTTALLLFLTP